MRISHPLWRGFFLACAMTAALFLLGETDSLAPFRLERKALAFAGALVVGGFIAAFPRRLTRNRSAAPRTTWQKCLRAFLCGAAMSLGLGMAGSGRILPGLMTGSVGAYAFCGAALTAGFAAVRIAEGRARR